MEQSKQIREIKEHLVQLGTLEQGISGINGFSKWRARFNKRFHTLAEEDLPMEQCESALLWLRNRVCDLEHKSKTREARLSRKEKYAAIKAKMRQMYTESGDEKYKDTAKESFYDEVRQGLRLKRRFRSLTELSDKDLDGVFGFVNKLGIEG